MGLDFQIRLREGFLALAKEAPNRVHVIDGRGSAQEVAHRIRALVP